MQHFLRAMEMDFATALEAVALQTPQFFDRLATIKVAQPVDLTLSEINMLVALLDTIVFVSCETNAFSLTKLNAYLVDVDRGIAHSALYHVVLTP